MPENYEKRVYAGYYKRFDGVLIYVITVTKDFDTGEDTVICKYVRHSENTEYFTITKQSFCEKVEWNGNLVDKYVRQTQYRIDDYRIDVLESEGFSGPKRKIPKPTLDEYDTREYRRSKDYYAYAKDLCEHYVIDFRKYELCTSRKKYVAITAPDFAVMKEDLIFLQQCLKTVLKDYSGYFKERFVDGLSIRKYAQAHNLNRGSVDYIQKKLFTALAAELKVRDETDGICRLYVPSVTVDEEWLQEIRDEDE